MAGKKITIDGKAILKETGEHGETSYTNQATKDAYANNPLRSNVNKIARKKLRPYERISDARSAEPISSKRAVGQTDGTAGIASPLTEVDDSRTYHEQKVIVSSDGIFTIVYEPINTMSFTDANGQSVRVVYQDVTVTQ